MKRASDEEEPHFQTGDGQTKDSVTKQCQLLSNEVLRLRVLDVPGFADSDTAYSLGVYEANLSIFRWILRVQIELGLKFDRVVYFFPQRGAPEKADGSIQEELKVMNYFFGSAIFETMVIIATNHHRKQRYGFDEEDKADMQSIVTRSLQLITRTEKETPKCPPIVYLGLSDTGEEILAKLKSALVINDSGLAFKFKDTVCARCAVSIRYAEHAATNKSGITFKRIGITDREGDFKDYKSSLCHPAIIPKHSRLEKFLGGIIHIVTLGGAYIYGKFNTDDAVPFFFNSDEICPACGQPPGARGCHPVGNPCIVEWNGSPVEIHVDHSNEVDDIKIIGCGEDHSGDSSAVVKFNESSHTESDNETDTFCEEDRKG